MFRLLDRKADVTTCNHERSVSSHVDVSRVVVAAEGDEGAVAEELDPVDQQLQRHEVAEPGGRAPAAPHHHADVGQP